MRPNWLTTQRRSRVSGQQLVSAAVASAALVVVGAELLHQRAARTAIATGSGSTVVVVLGFPTRRNGQPHPVQRWRVNLGIRTMRSSGAESILFTGGSPANEYPEAETMARLAIRSGIQPDAILTETNAESTWQNVAYSAPLTTGFDRVILASDPLHARRAHRYWVEQHPHDVARVFISDRRRPFEGAWYSVISAGVEVLRELRRRLTTR